MSALPTTTTPTTAASRPAPTGWIFSRPIDLLLIANMGWPLIAMLVVAWPTLTGASTPSGQMETLSMVQVYLLSAPHRWITLPLVLADPRHMADKGRFFAIAAGLTLGGLALAGLGMVVPYGPTTLTYLMIVDFVWNSWHFAAQHAGISRIYGRQCHPDDTFEQMDFEKMALRTMVLWTFLRVAIHHGIQNNNATVIPTLGAVLQWFDPVALALPAYLVVKEWRRANDKAWGRIAYMTSVVALYGSVLVGLRLGGRMLLGILIAHAVFHAVEYFAVVGWAASKKTGGIWNAVAPRVAVWTVFFVAVIGAFNWGVAAWDLYYWALMTLIISFIHYAWDGMIWKAPKARVSSAPA